MQTFEGRKFDKVLFDFSFEYFNVCCRLSFSDIRDTSRDVIYRNELECSPFRTPSSIDLVISL